MRSRPLDAAARIAHIRAERWVQHAAADRVLGYLQEALDQPSRERMENILLIGESGMGKTMLVRKFERQNAAPFDDVTGVQRKPVVVMLMPHQPTEGQFFNQLLHALNAPSPGHFTRGFPVQDPAVRLLRHLGTRVVVIDEINSALAGTPRQQRIFLQLLRFLSNKLRIAFVGVGVPEARHALLSDSQLRSRFTDVELSPWCLGEDLRDFVTRLAWSLPLREPSPVDSPKLRRLLADRTGGITLGICNAFERAAIAAIRNGREKLELRSFNAIALNVNRLQGLQPHPASAADAVRIAESYIARGFSVDVGLMQVNSRNLPALGYTLEQALDPCTNITAGGRILTANYAEAVRRLGEGQPALLAALSAYNTGDYSAGFRNGYVAKYVGSTSVPALGGGVRQATASMTAAARPAARKTAPSPYTADIAIEFTEVSSAHFVQ